MSEIFVLRATLAHDYIIHTAFISQMWMAYERDSHFIAWVNAHPNEIHEDDLSFATATLRGANASVARRRMDALGSGDIDSDARLDAFILHSPPFDPTSVKGGARWMRASLRMKETTDGYNDSTKRPSAKQNAAKYKKPILDAETRCRTTLTEAERQSHQRNGYTARMRALDIMQRCSWVFQIAVGAYPAEGTRLTRDALAQPSAAYAAVLAAAFGATQREIPAALRALALSNRDTRPIHALVLDLIAASSAKAHATTPAVKAPISCPDLQIKVVLDYATWSMFGTVPDAVSADSHADCAENIYVAHLNARDGLPPVNVTFAMHLGTAWRIEIKNE